MLSRYSKDDQIKLVADRLLEIFFFIIRSLNIELRSSNNCNSPKNIVSKEKLCVFSSCVKMDVKQYYILMDTFRKSYINARNAYNSEVTLFVNI